jgi:polyferredoxin
MLKAIRILAASVCFILITLLFLDFTGTARVNVGWLSRIQFVPALFAANLAVLTGLVVVTLLLGRVYCSILCPLGVLQDAVAWISRKIQRKKRYTYLPALNLLRYGLLALVVIAFFAGLAPVVALLDPYGSYGRIASNIAAPFYRWGNNLLASHAAQSNSLDYYTVDIWIRGAATFAVALVTLGVIGFLAWRNGRTYCNTVCPVGTVLGFLSRFAVLKPVVNVSKCNGCRICERGCKASCIDARAHQIDYSRCVACMNCVGACPQGALGFGHKNQPPQTVNR